MIVPPASFRSVLPVPVVKMPSENVPVVVITPLLIRMLLLPVRSDVMPSNVLHVTVIAPELVTWLWSRTRRPLAVFTLIAPPGRLLQVTLVLPATAWPRVGSGVGGDVSQVAV